MDVTLSDVAAQGAATNDAATADVAPIVCNTLTSTAPWIGGVYVADYPPIPNGGVVDDGTYFMAGIPVSYGTSDAGTFTWFTNWGYQGIAATTFTRQ